MMRMRKMMSRGLRVYRGDGGEAAGAVRGLRALRVRRRWAWMRDLRALGRRCGGNEGGRRVREEGEEEEGRAEGRGRRTRALAW